MRSPGEQRTEDLTTGWPSSRSSLSGDLAIAASRLALMSAWFIGIALCPGTVWSGHPAKSSLAGSPATVTVEPPDSAPQAGASRRRSGSGMYKGTIRPNWSADGRHLWYRNEVRGGEWEYVVVDLVAGRRQAAFDHDMLAAALRKSGMNDVDPRRLAVQALEFSLESGRVDFSLAGRRWRFDPAQETVTELDSDPNQIAPEQTALPFLPRASVRTGAESSITVINDTEADVQLQWLDTSGRRQSYGSIKANGLRDQHTYAGHVWVVVDSEGELLAAYEARDQHLTVHVTGKVTRERRPRREQRSPDGNRGDRSPDGKWTASVRDHNIVLRSNETDVAQSLTSDGSEEDSYQMLRWSPDSRTLLAFRTQPGEHKPVFLIESSPEEGGRAELATRTYDLPGDRLDACELNLFDVSSGTQLKPALERIDLGRPRVRWNRSGDKVLVEKVDRGHQRFRLLEVSCATGEVRSLIDEKSETFIWTQHGPPVPITTYLSESDELIHASEQSGWRHLYLVDLQSGTRRPITSGPWVVRGIERIDEKQRQIWLTASGLDADQDPYLVHYLRVNFDGSGLTRLTEGNGTHSVEYSPDGQYLIDSWSRVDQPPVHELRKTVDGSLVCELERADIRELLERGWRAPEVFSAKGRDGETDIWGIICWPDDLDRDSRYPVIEDIYAGPHDSHVPKSFSPTRRYASLTELGFVVVKIDGMGTANRSKAFHDVCWQNLKDAGFPDRIRWMEAAGRKYPWMDLTRVGIYGTSAGGQNAAGAVLFHADFYKAAVAACGCHDNRMDKLSWNEQWMGYPVGPHYSASSNIDQAGQLGGELMLIVGELDTNVPPESTLRFVDALIKADKDFELLVIPGMGHSSGGAYGDRKRIDFFRRHLLTAAPAD